MKEKEKTKKKNNLKKIAVVAAVGLIFLLLATQNKILFTNQRVEIKTRPLKKPIKK